MFQQNQSETVSYSASAVGEDGASERVRFDDNVSIIGPSSTADFLPDTLGDKHSICSSRSFRSFGKNSITEELSESLDKASIGSGARNVIFEENLGDAEDSHESPNSHRSNSQSSLPGTRRTLSKMTLKSAHKQYTSFEEDVVSKTPPEIAKYLERTDKVINLRTKQNKLVLLTDKVAVSSSYADGSVQCTTPTSAEPELVESPESLLTPVNEIEFNKPAGTFQTSPDRDVETGCEIPKRPLSKVAMLRNIFFHGSLVLDGETEQLEDNLLKPSNSETFSRTPAKEEDNNETITIVMDSPTNL